MRRKPPQKIKWLQPKCHRESEIIARKQRESDGESKTGVQPFCYHIFDAAQMCINCVIIMNTYKSRFVKCHKFRTVVSAFASGGDTFAVTPWQWPPRQRFKEIQICFKTLYKTIQQTHTCIEVHRNIDFWNDAFLSCSRFVSFNTWYFSEIGQDTLPRVALQVMAASMCSTYAASSECFTRGVWWFLSVVSDIEMLAMIGNDDKKC